MSRKNKNRTSIVGTTLAAILALVAMIIGSGSIALADDPAPNQQPPTDNGGNTNCGLDKVSTINEVDAAKQQRIEVGGGGTQHVEYYPDRGINTISYVVGPQEPVIWMGFGSIWEGQCDQSQFDYLADAAGYAHGSSWQPGRLNNGHSGLVMDTRDCTLYDTLWSGLDENGQAKRQLFIDDLLAADRASQETVLCGDLTSADVQPYDVEGGNTVDNPGNNGQPTGSASCTTGISETFVSNFHDRQLWIISTGDRWGSVNFWSNWTDPNYGSVKFLLAPNTDISLKGGGDITYIPGECTEDEARAILAGSNNPEINLVEIPARYRAR